MTSMYHCPGIVTFPLAAGPYPLFDATNQQFFYGYMPTAEGAGQALYPLQRSHKLYDEEFYGSYGFDPAAVFEQLRIGPAAEDYTLHRQGWGGLTQQQEHQKTNRHPKPGKGFFSQGRGDAPTWRTRATSSPDQSSKCSTSRKEAQRDNNVKKTIYITDVDQQITEEQLASFFKDCGEVVDCRVCGDPNSAMRFAFIEFFSADSAEQAIKKNGVVLGEFPLRVLPSKTAIVPVNNQYLPKTIKEREQCSRTIYTANIDKKVDRESVKLFFETLCGPVNRIRLLGDWQHATRIAFVEFLNAESAKNALSCSGALLGSLPVRVSPSKTPVRDDSTSASAIPAEKQPSKDSKTAKSSPC